MSHNKSMKDFMIKKYGEECWIEKLHLRKDTEKRVYKSKKQMRRMKQLTYHHILEKAKGGKTTEENGSILSVENHAWLHQQSEEIKNKLNSLFQEYKRDFNKRRNTSKRNSY